MKNYIDSNKVYMMAVDVAYDLVKTLPFSIRKTTEVVEKAMLKLLEEEDERRSKRKCNQIAEGADLVTDIRDDDGLRRYDLGAVGDEPCMVPSATGRWVLANDVSKRAKKEMDARIGI